MNVVEIAEALRKGKLSLLQACRLLDTLGYTFQEIRRVVRGVGRSIKIRNGEALEPIEE